MAETAELDAAFIDDVRRTLAEPPIIRSKQARITHSVAQVFFVTCTWNGYFGLSRALATLLVGVPYGFLVYWEEERNERLWLERSRNVTDELVAKMARRSQRCRKCRAIILPAFWDACRKCRTSTWPGRWAMVAVVFTLVAVLSLAAYFRW